MRKDLLAGKGAKARRRVLSVLGPGDKLVVWERPARRVKWLSIWRWTRMPECLTLREITYRVNHKGFRNHGRCMTVITTLLDPECYPAQEIAELYLQRWEVETCFRHLKQTLEMQCLRTKTLAGVEKELLVRQLAYNLVRAVMLEAAQRQGVEPSRISFVDALRWLLCARAGEELPPLIVNPVRPGRFEPRLLKRRDKNYRHLNCPRAQAKALLLKARAA